MIDTCQKIIIGLLVVLSVYFIYREKDTQKFYNECVQNLPYSFPLHKDRFYLR